MKKLLGVSLMAIMAVSAARADIASTAYVTNAVSAEAERAAGVEGTLSSLTTEAQSSLVAAINEVDDHADTNAGNISDLTTLVGTLPSGISATTVTGYVAEAVAAAAGDASDAIAGLNVADTKGEQTGTIVKNVTESAGLVAATYGLVENADVATTAAITTNKIGALTDYQLASEAADIAATDTLNVALGKLQKQIDTADTAISNEATARANAITALNKASDVGTGNVVASVAETAGIVTATMGNVIDAVAVLPEQTGNVVTSITEGADGRTLNYAKGITAVTVPASNSNSVAGTYVLTAEIDNNGAKTYHWEQISRPAAQEPAGE